MTNTESKQLREELDNILFRICFEDDQGQRHYLSPESGGYKKYINKVMQIFHSHEAQIKQDIFKKVEGIIGEVKPKRNLIIIRHNELDFMNDSFRAHNQAIDEYEVELRASLKALEEKEIGK